MGLSWGDDPVPHPTVPQMESGLAARVIEALGERARGCRRTDLYGSRSLAWAAIRARRRGLAGRWRHRRWRPWTCPCGWIHIGPPGDR